MLKQRPAKNVFQNLLKRPDWNRIRCFFITPKWSSWSLVEWQPVTSDAPKKISFQLKKDKKKPNLKTNYKYSIPDNPLTLFTLMPYFYTL